MLKESTQDGGSSRGGPMRFVQRFLHDLKTPLYKNAVYIMANTISNNVFGFVFWIVIAWSYPVSEFGLGVALIAVATLIAGFSRLGLDAGLIRYLPEAGGGERSMINSTLTISGGLAIFLAVVFVLGVEFWSPALGFLLEDAYLLIAFVVFTVFFALSPAIDNVFIAKRAARYVLYKNMVYHVTRIGLVAVLTFGLFGFLISWSIGLLLAITVGLLHFLTKVVPSYKPLLEVNGKAVSQMFHFSIGNYVAGMLMLMPAMVLPIMIVNFVSSEETAFFYVAWMIAGILYIIPGAMGTSLFAEGSHSRSEFRTDVLKSITFVFTLTILGIILLFLLGGHVLLVFGSDFSQGALDLLKILALSGIFVSINTIYFATKRVEKRMMPVVLLSALIAFGSLGIGFMLLDSMGLVGIGIGWMIAQGTASAIVGMLYMVSLLRKRNDVNSRTL